MTAMRKLHFHAGHIGVGLIALVVGLVFGYELMQVGWSSFIGNFMYFMIFLSPVVIILLGFGLISFRWDQLKTAKQQVEPKQDE